VRAPRTRIKFCGMTSPHDVALAVEAGADAVGVIAAESPRRVAETDLRRLAAAVPPLVDRIAVVVDPSEREAAQLRELGFTLQFSGEEAAERCELLAGGLPYVKAFHLPFDGPAEARSTDGYAAYARALWMFDTRGAGRYGGTGVPFDWSAVAGIARERDVVVAGGLTPENVGTCVRTVRPYAVDVRGGVETADAKDVEKMRAFVRAVREADAEA